MRGQLGLGLLAMGLSIIDVRPVLAHGGGLDASGCHHDRKRGGYHCHGGAAARRPIQSLYEPVRSSGSFRNCTAARAAGAAPVRIGDPGYGRHLDRDGDGIGCE